jgi:hypothetical protein
MVGGYIVRNNLLSGMRQTACFQQTCDTFLNRHDTERIAQHCLDPHNGYVSNNYFSVFYKENMKI